MMYIICPHKNETIISMKKEGRIKSVIRVIFVIRAKTPDII